jgi:hypothetical protein
VNFQLRDILSALYIVLSVWQNAENHRLEASRKAVALARLEVLYVAKKSCELKVV